MMMRKTIGLSLALLVASTAAMAREVQSAHHQPVPSLKAKPAKSATAPARFCDKRQTTGRAAVRSARRPARHARQTAAAQPPPDQYVGPMRVVGQREIGSAAWYGGKHLGLRTASGERLDAVRATAAHRSLPLHSLVRVTNLSNGRSVIAKITDRGPVSRSLLIDVSPRVADELDMKRAGIAPVAVEPVAPEPVAPGPVAPVTNAAANPATSPAADPASPGVNPAANPAQR
jgi:rare lipoprotein A